MNCKIKVRKTVIDQRSYRQNSDKLLKTGFKRKFSVEHAIKELVTNFKNGSIKKNDDRYFTVKYMKKLGF